MTALLIIGICFTFVGCFFFGFISGLAAGGYIKGYREGNAAAYKHCETMLDKEIKRLKNMVDDATLETIERYEKEGIL